MKGYRVLKYQFQIADNITIAAPRESSFLKVEIQNEIPTMWLLVPDDLESTGKYFTIFGTGQQIFSMRGKRYLDTFFDQGYVWHLFETTAPGERIP